MKYYEIFNDVAKKVNMRRSLSLSNIFVKMTIGLLNIGVMIVIFLYSIVSTLCILMNNLYKSTNKEKKVKNIKKSTDNIVHRKYIELTRNRM